jgi:hypothetical protein
VLRRLELLAFTVYHRSLYWLVFNFDTFYCWYYPGTKQSRIAATNAVAKYEAIHGQGSYLQDYPNGIPLERLLSLSSSN